jgi:acyl transferase domain-containing protein
VNTPAQYWRLLHDGVNAVGDIPSDRWDAEALYDPDPQAAGKMYTKVGGFLDDISGFDPGFFGIAPREAATMDPQQRLLLMVSWEAIEHAGLVPDARSRTIGVFVGISTNDYAQLLMERADLRGIDGYSLTGNSPSVASGRIAYALGLQGPAVSVDTACSSSLVALHLACQSLRRQECDAALAGGVNVMLSPFYHVAFCRLGALSRTGACRTFDAAADGFVRGEGCGVVVLKRLADAISDRDRILALVRGSAVNQDGRSSGLTVPYGPAQQEVMRRALRTADVEPRQVTFVEAHGTGTSLGDPVELQSLAAVYGARSGDRPLLTGSVKTNFGHLEAAAGVAGLIKVVLALEHGEMPPQLHFHEPNPRVDWAALPLRVVTSPTTWPSESPRLAAVSAFGISGTNAHVVLQDADAYRVEPKPPEASHHLFTLSAKSDEQLRALAARVAGYVAMPGAATPEAICHTVHTRRAHFDWRLAAVVRSRDGIERAALASAASKPAAEAVAVHRGRRVASALPRITFMFAGQGGQLVGVGEELHRSQPVFRDAIERCTTWARDYLNRPLSDLMFASDRRGQPFPDLVSSHIALFALQYGLWQLWQSWGVEPSVIVAQSLGEFAAAVAADVFDAEAGLMLVAERARLTAEITERSAMAVVLASDSRLQRALEELAGEVWSAGRNTPEETLVAGRAHAVNRLLDRCEGAGIQVRRLRAFAEYAPHTPIMEPVMAALAHRIESLKLRRPAFEVISASTGAVVDEALQSPEYWHAQSCRPFDMVAAVKTWVDKHPTVALELGPGATTLGIARRCAPHIKVSWLPSLRTGTSESAQMLDALAALYAGGANVNWRRFHANDVQPGVELPFTPLQVERYWLPDAPVTSPVEAPEAASGVDAWLGRRLVSPVEIAQFVAVIDGHSVGFLPDHRVHDRIVVAASAHISRALAAAQRVYGRAPRSIDELLFLQPLVLTEGQRVNAALTLEPGKDSKARLTISSAAKSGDPWVTHVTGTLNLEPATTPPATSIHLDTARTRCQEPVSVGAFYAALEARGYRMGASFRWLDAIWRGDGTAVARLRERPLEGDDIPPGLIDAALQLLTATWPQEGLPTYVPYAIDSFRLHREPIGRLWGVASLTGDGVDRATIVGDVSVCNQAGEPVIDIVGLRARAVTREILDQLVGAGRQEASVASQYRLEWKLSGPQTPRAIEPCLWIVFDDCGVAGRLVPLLEAHGHTCVTVEPGDVCERVAGNRYRIRPTEASDYHETLADILAATGLPARVVHLWSLRELEDATDLAGAQLWGCESLLLAVQAAAASTRRDIRVRCVTAGSAGPAATPAAFPMHAAVWGFGPAIAREYPQLWDGLIDATGMDPGAVADMLSRELLGANGTERVALRSDGRYVPHLAGQGPLETPSISSFPSDSTWLVTGGLGFIGQHVTSWLIERGVRHVALLGRSDPNAQAQQVLREWQREGADVVFRRADVADRASLSVVIADLESEMPRLDGVIHLAGILDDATIGNETLEHWRRVFAPKAIGAWNLHQVTAHLPLRYFVLFSSAASVFGAPGQNAYCSANAVLDALAGFRRRAGLPAVAINWGPWSGGGMSAIDQKNLDRWRRFGLEALSAHEALAHLASIMAEAPEQLLVVRQSRPRGAGTDREISSLLSANAAGGGLALERDEAFLASLARSAVASRRMLLIDRLRRLAAAVLGLPRTAAIDVDQPLQELGMDSLMAVDMRNAVVELTGENLPITVTFDYPSLGTMADHLLGSVLRLDQEPVSPDPGEDLAREIDALTDAEAADRLARTLSRLGS